MFAPNFVDKIMLFQPCYMKIKVYCKPFLVKCDQAISDVYITCRKKENNVLTISIACSIHLVTLSMQYVTYKAEINLAKASKSFLCPLDQC